MNKPASPAKPPPFGGLLELVGPEAFERLSIIYGGTRIYICASKIMSKRLDIIVGDDLGKKIIECYDGESIEIPKNFSQKNFDRIKSVRADRDVGMTVRELALKYECTERAIRDAL